MSGVGGGSAIQFPKSEFPRGAGRGRGGRRFLRRRSIISNYIISFNRKVRELPTAVIGRTRSAVRIRTPDPPLQATAAFRVYPRLRPHFPQQEIGRAHV